MPIIVAESEAELIRRLAELIERLSNEALRDADVFRVGVSGGSLVKFLSEGLPTVRADFSRWKVFFCDERVVPVEDADSTFGVYKSNLLGKVDLKEDQFVQIKQGVSAEEAAKDYIKQMSSHFPPDSLPRFDLLLLGIGPDGHTCSLFPGHELLEEKNAWAAPITDSPKPPSCRVTLTLPVINNAKCCIFALSGEGKAGMVKRILQDKEDLPAARVKPTSGSLYWLLDGDAAKLIKENDRAVF